MSQSGFLITPYDPADESQWYSPIEHQLDFHDLSASLKKLWPHAEVSVRQEAKQIWADLETSPRLVDTSEIEQVFRCSLPSKNDIEFVARITNLTASFSEWPKEIVIAFIIWYRSYIPSKISLYLFLESPDDSLFLVSETSKSEIEEFCGWS